MVTPGILELECGAARASISLTGAELTRWRIGDRELLWTPDPEIWGQVSPILFPVVGWCRNQTIKVDGVAYPMPVHGFAATSRFEIEDASGDHAVLLLRDNAQTRAHYPFSFTLRVTYTLGESAIEIGLSVTNNDSKELVFACGLHPGFAVPFAGGSLDDYAVEFEQGEQPRVPVIAEGGLFSRESRPIPLFGKRLALNRDVFENEAMCFLNARSREFSLHRAGHGRLSVAVENFPHLAIWSVPDAPFVSLEAWTGHGDEEKFTGEFSEKSSMIGLQPGAIGRASAVFSFSDD